MKRLLQVEAWISLEQRRVSRKYAKPSEKIETWSLLGDLVKQISYY